MTDTDMSNLASVLGAVNPVAAPVADTNQEGMTTDEAQAVDKMKADFKDTIERLSTAFIKNGQLRPGLDEKFYQPEEKEVKFFKQQTGIQDDEALKRHIMEVQAEAYAVRAPFY